MKKNSHGFSTFWTEIRFKYKLSVLNENTLEEVFSFRLSLLSGFLALLALVVFLIALTSIVIINTPIRNYLPGYMDSEMRIGIMNNALKVDSLEQILQQQSQYLNNISAIMRDDISVSEISQMVDTVSVDIDNLNKKSKALTQFIRSFEEEEKYNLNVLTASNALPDNLLFYRPARGFISNHFNPKEKHYGIDIAAAPKESVLATMKGMVFLAGFEANSGYMIQIQHANGFVSVYKHNALLLKKQGDAVSAGEAIAIVGNTGELSSGNHLHFELWHNGKPVNPEEFIAF
jgi:murein DD-endopeptidase MepM/ murein hydrolase activator NlpD